MAGPQSGGQRAACAVDLKMSPREHLDGKAEGIMRKSSDLGAPPLSSAAHSSPCQRSRRGPASHSCWRRCVRWGSWAHLEGSARGRGRPRNSRCPGRDGSPGRPREDVWRTEQPTWRTHLADPVFPGLCGPDFSPGTFIFRHTHSSCRKPWVPHAVDVWVSVFTSVDNLERPRMLISVRFLFGHHTENPLR